MDHDDEMDHDWQLPSTSNFNPGDDDLTDTAQDKAYADYAADVRRLAKSASQRGQPVFQRLYNEVPDFDMLTGILTFATLSKTPETEAAAKGAIDKIDSVAKKQRTDAGLNVHNEFYASPQTGLGWHTQYDTEDDRWVDQPTPIVVDKKQNENAQLTDAIQAALYQGMTDTWGDRVGGIGLSGKFESGTTFQGAKSYADHPGTLILFEVSRALYNYALNTFTKTTEVQALCVADRIVACANESLAEKFLAKFKSTQMPSLLQLIKKVTENPEKYAYVTPKIAGRDARVLDDSHRQTVEALKGLIKPDEAAKIIAAAAATDQAEIVRTVMETVVAGKAWEAGSYEQAATWLNTAGKEKGVFWMDPPDIGACHAEGALVALLVASGIKTPALITGTMRPCTGCYLTLRFARERLGVSLLGAPSHNGGFWESTQTGGMLALISAFTAGQLKNLPLYQQAGKAQKEQINEAFRLEGVETFCLFLQRNFPESSNASNLRSAETELMPPGQKTPNVAQKRTLTPPADHIQSYFDKTTAAEEKPPPTKKGTPSTSKKRKRGDIDT